MDGPAQKHLQTELDQLLGRKSMQDVGYETFNRLSGTFITAVIYEQLRLVPSVIVIPKRVMNDQLVTIDGRSHLLPDQPFIHLNAVGTGRNPKLWPHAPSRRTTKEHDLDDFVPERWLLSEPKKGSREKSMTKTAANGATEGQANSTFLTPERGAFIPFSEGQRACLGRRFAMVEITAVLATIFQEYAVELAVDQWASDAEVEQMTSEEKAAVYQKATDRAWWLVEHGCESLVTLKLRKGRIPLRFVKRGNERFL